MERYEEQSGTEAGRPADRNGRAGEGETRPLATFQVVTDTHIRDDANHVHNRHFEAALEDLASFGEGSLGLMHVGDVTDRGLAAEYAEFRRIWRERPAGLPDLYVTLGNHDIGAVLWEEGGTPLDLSALPGYEIEDALDGRFSGGDGGESREEEEKKSVADAASAAPVTAAEKAGSADDEERPPNAAESLAAAAEAIGLDLAGMAARLSGSEEADRRARELWERRMRRFAEGTGEAAPYHDHWLGGYHFVFLGSESPHPKDCDLSPAQLAWLKERLAEESSPDRPVFLFLHQPLQNTVAGSTEEQGWHGVNQDAALKEILAGCPQAILFTGHTHWQIQAKRTMFDGRGALPTMFNASSVGYLWTDRDEHLEGSEGLQVEIHEDRVVVRGRDFVNRGWIEGAEYAVSYPVSRSMQSAAPRYS
ncbi:metallophosphoesterase family protein [Saccharibacillus alkalitolerans]|uniref:Metallophosphoesterase n=1 Tax=Saccharibacillus alkalitolerans TaxID=2705290 RepID=A0ABX0F994_9BACL|nr:metallophosphoesterase family protein [Saccharibacillus alkalitolerans]NGZ77000.1 metallophosphoesterase [Saccharibacillus alkalitolerans]